MRKVNNKKMLRRQGCLNRRFKLSVKLINSDHSKFDITHFDYRISLISVSPKLLCTIEKVIYNKSFQILLYNMS